MLVSLLQNAMQNQAATRPTGPAATILFMFLLEHLSFGADVRSHSNSKNAMPSL
jgi:hypothetical protein